MNSLFSENSVQGNGGAIFFNFAYSPFLNNSVFNRNEAKKNGGAVYSYSSYNLIMANSSFVENAADVGGAVRTIFIDADVSSNVSFSGGSARVYGADVIDYCVIGEYKTDTDCLACGSDLYSIVEKDASACKVCPEGQAKCVEGYKMNLTAGYWRKHNYSDVIVHCANYPDNCLGGTHNFTCAQGHVGALCEACDFYGQKWGKAYANSGTYICGKCSDQQYNSAIIVAITIFTMFLIAQSIRTSLQLVEKQAQDNTLKSM